MPSNWKGLLAIILLALACISIRFDEILDFPDYKVIEPYGDGFKAYTVIYYHAKYDSTYSHFEGMNYPYGEHVVPGATQPILSTVIKYISANFTDITPYTFHLVHLLMLFSIFLCAVFVYLIMRRLDTPAWYSVLIAIGLTFLAPQINRMHSHYGLAHPAVIPAVIYFLMRWHEAKHWRWSAYIMITVFCYSMIHFYYFAILTFLVSFFFLFHFLQEITWKRFQECAFHYTIQLLIPLAFFFWWMILNDPIPDRVSVPWGYLHYRAKWHGVFVSLVQPYFAWFHNKVHAFGWLDFENKAYLGLAGVGATALLVYYWLRNRLKKGAIPFETEQASFLNKMFYGSIVILLFSFGLPFILPGMDSLIKYTGPIKQFRGIGRFVWVFYFTINIIGFASLYHWLKERNWKPAVFWPALLLPCFVLLFEAYNHIKAEDVRLDEIQELKPGNTYPEVTSIDFSNYQAILPIPYYSIGSDNFWYPPSGYINQKSQVMSVQTGLPVTGAMLTRSSPSQTIEQLQLIMEPYRRPKIFDQYPNDKPLIMAWDEVRYQENRTPYAHLENAGPLLYEAGELKVLEVPLNSYDARIAARKDSIVQALADTLFNADPFFSRDSAATFIYDSFDEAEAEKHYQGEGGQAFKLKRWVTAWEGAAPDTLQKQWVASFWMYIDQDLVPRTDFELVQLNDFGSELKKNYQQIRQFVKAIDNNGWGLLELPFELDPRTTKLQIRMKNSDLHGHTVFWDELLIRPITTDLYQSTPAYLWKNNRFFPRDTE
ncbi:MAG: hypothetical protein HRU41_28680 [Saprospiraceae bacterium]|nr:hypothetical protein [Saprospiraceae bacterium]